MLVLLLSFIIAVVFMCISAYIIYLVVNHEQHGLLDFFAMLYALPVLVGSILVSNVSVFMIYMEILHG